MKTNAALSATFLVLFISSCSTVTRQSEGDSQEALAREVQDEIRIGRAMAAKLFGHFGPYTSNTSELEIEYLNLVGQTLAQKVGRPEIIFRFGILNSDGFNAYAAPGGYIFVTKGLLKHLQSESELAAVLAHEIAHVNERHMYNEIVPKREVTAGETVARMLARGHSDLGKSITQIVNRGLKILLEDGWGMEKEREADQAALLYTASTGYNPTSLATLLKRVHQNGSQIKVSKTAPSLSERMAAVEKVISENGLGNKIHADATILEKRFKQSLAALHKNN